MFIPVLYCLFWGFSTTFCSEDSIDPFSEFCEKHNGFRSNQKCYKLLDFRNFRQDYLNAPPSLRMELFELTPDLFNKWIGRNGMVTKNFFKKDQWRHSTHLCRYLFHPEAKLPTFWDDSDMQVVQSIMEEYKMGFLLGYAEVLQLPSGVDAIPDSQGRTTDNSEWLLLPNNTVSEFSHWGDGFPFKDEFGILVTFISYRDNFKWKHHGRNVFVDVNPALTLCEISELDDWAVDAGDETGLRPSLGIYEVSDFKKIRKQQREKGKRWKKKKKEEPECHEEQGSKAKVFQIGVSEFELPELFQLFEKSGVKSIHSKHEILGSTLKANFKQGNALLTGIDDYQGYFHMDRTPGIMGFQFYKLLDEQYPNSKFIFNFRGFNKWVVTRAAGEDGLVVDFEKKYHGVMQSELWDVWQVMWNTAMESVREHFKDRPDDCLIINVEKEPISTLIEWLEKSGIHVDEQFWTPPQFPKLLRLGEMDGELRMGKTVDALLDDPMSGGLDEEGERRRGNAQQSDERRRNIREKRPMDPEKQRRLDELRKRDGIMGRNRQRQNNMGDTFKQLIKESREEREEAGEEFDPKKPFRGKLANLEEELKKRKTQ